MTKIITLRITMMFLIVFVCGLIVDSFPQLFADIRCEHLGSMNPHNGFFHLNHDEIGYHYRFNHFLIVLFQWVITIFQFMSMLQYINDND